MKKALLFVAPVCLALATMLCWDAPETVSSDYTSRDVLHPIGEAEGALWYNNLLRANPATGKIDQRDVLLVKERVQEFAKAQNNRSATLELGWKDLGPDNIGGRTRAVWSDSDSELWIGSVSGGVWHSTNAGNTWTQVPSPSTVIGSICRMGNGTLVIGTGNTFESGGGGNGGSGFIGAGLFYSNDDGQTWTILDETEPTFMSTNDNWNEINALIPDPNNDDGLWIGGRAGLTYWDMGSDDVTTGGWDGLDNSTIQDMSMSADGNVFLVASGTRVYRSTNNGENFTLVSGTDDNELPQNGKSRVRVRVSQTDSDHCFAAYAANNGSWGGVWYSGDAGQNWEPVWSDSDELGFDPAGDNRQGYYDLALGIDPVDPTIAYCAAVTLWKVGANYNPEQIALNFAFPGSPLYVHSDIHEIYFTQSGTMLIGCDGGMHRSTDYANFTQINRGYNVTQFYSIAHSSGDPVIGGTQDNGTLLITGPEGGFYSDQEALEIGGGDGFDCEITQVTENENLVVYTTVYRGALRRFDSEGGGGMFYDDEILELMNDEGEIGNDFYMDVRLFEDTEDDESEQYIILINPADSTIYDPAPDDADVDAVLPIQTLNLNIDHFYRLDATDPDYAPLMYWDSIVRDPFVSDMIITESPEPYWWLDVPTLEDSTVTCLTDSTFIGIQTVIDEIIPIIECEYIEVLDSTLCFETGADTTYMDIDVYEYEETCTTEYNYAGDIHYDVPEHRKIQDRYTSITTCAFDGTNGLWMTREGLNLNVTPDWFKVVNTTGVGVKNMEYTPDGNHLYWSNYGSNLFRIDDIDQLWSAEDVENTTNQSILSAGGTVTGIAVDPNDKDHVVITVGGYGTNSAGKVRESFNATSDSPTFNNIWFPTSDDLSRMPCYDAVIDVTDSQRIMVGTEFGIFVTTNGGDDWEMCNDPSENEEGLGIGMTPVYDLRQQEYESKRFIDPTNVGVIYAGTHGRGIHSTQEWAFVGVDDTEAVLETQPQLLVYPNPTLGNLNVEVTLGQVMDVTIDIFAADGRWVKSITRNNMVNGTQTVSLDVSDLTNGNYILRLQTGTTSNTARFVVMK